MDKAEIINPKDRKSKCKCSLCNLTYTPKDYQLLFDTEKLIFLSYVPPQKKRAKIVCHSCLLTLVKSYRTTEVKISIQIIDKERDGMWSCYNYANDIEDDVVDLSFFP